jgi:hypothetical protein
VPLPPDSSARLPVPGYDATHVKPAITRPNTCRTKATPWLATTSGSGRTRSFCLAFGLLTVPELEALLAACPYVNPVVLGKSTEELADMEPPPVDPSSRPPENQPQLATGRPTPFHPTAKSKPAAPPPTHRGEEPTKPVKLG